MNIFKNAWVKFTSFLGQYQWKSTDILSEEETTHIQGLLKTDYYIMLSRRNNHLSTYLISLAHFILTGKFSYWAHAFMNTENNVHNDSDFRIVEALQAGVGYTPFDKVFDVNGVVLLKPKHMSIDKWTAVLDKARNAIGIPYDNLFDLKNDKALSCVELIRYALMAEPDYLENFSDFERLIKSRGNLTPQMFYDCNDFEVVYEIRRS